MTSTRVITVAALALLAGLIVAATSLAAADTSPGVTVEPTHLVVGPTTPTTATVLVTYTDSSGISITAHVTLDGAHDAAQLTGFATLGNTTVALTARSVGNRLYVDVPQFATLLGAPWIEIALSRDHDGVEAALRELRHPFVDRLHNSPGSRFYVAEPTSTTFTLRMPSVSLPDLSGIPIYLPRHGHLRLRIKQGEDGQLLSARIHVWDRYDDVRATVIVTGYDQPLAVLAPGARQVVVLTSPRARAVFGADARGIDRLLRELGGRLAHGPHR